MIAALAASPACRSTDAANIVSRRAADVVLARETTLVSARVMAGATLASILRAEGLTVDEVSAVIATVRSVFDPHKVRVDQPYRLEKAIGGALRTFEYEIDGERFLRVRRAAGRELAADVLPIPKTKRVETVRGRIDRSASSLVAAMDAAGETIDLTLAVAEIFGGEIDFNIDLQTGDTFQIAVEKQLRDSGAFAGYGPIAAAEFVNNGRRVRAVRFTPEGGVAGYYDERGVSMKRFLLASPLKFRPIVTSAFSRARLHPIIQEVRAHLGVDYRAPIGAPVVAVSDGIVLAAGWSGGSGNMVHLRHSNGFETEYLHLSAVSVRAGAHVQQGELIGRVGMTGLATGPHLDYRLRRNGVFVNPIAAHRAMPPAEPVPPSQMTAFGAAREAALERLRADRPLPSTPQLSGAAVIR